MAMHKRDSQTIFPLEAVHLSALNGHNHGTSSNFASSETLTKSTARLPDDDGLEFPEGGPGWLVVLGSWCALFPSLGIMNTMGAFEEYMSTHQLKDNNVSAVGWIFSLYAFLTFGVGLFVGPVFDRFGPRWLILSGSVLLVLSMDMVGYCKEFWHFIFVFSILGGVGSALVFSPSIAVIGHHFSRRRGIATGLATTGGAFGGILFPYILHLCIPRIGFLWSTKLIALISLILCSVANVLIKSRITSSDSTWPDIRILRRPVFAVTVAGVFLLEFALFVPLTYVNSYCVSRGFSAAFSASILPILNAGSVFGRVLPGYFADNFGRFNIAIVAISLTVLSVLAVWLPFGHTKAGLVIFALLFGLGSGSNISLTPVCVGQLCTADQYGRFYSTCFSIVSLGCLIGVPIAGKILEAEHGDYKGLVVFVGCCYAGGLVAFCWARSMMVGCGLGRKF